MGWHLACPSISLIVNYSQNMEPGHSGQARAIIKRRGVAEKHRRDEVRRASSPGGWHLKEQWATVLYMCVCVWNAVTWQSAPVSPSRRLSLFITLNISHETNEPDLSNESPFLLLENMMNILKWSRDEERLLMQRANEEIQRSRASVCQDHQSLRGLGLISAWKGQKLGRQEPDEVSQNKDN